MSYKCLICESPTTLLDVVDFNKNCEEARGVYVALSGFAVYYAICTRCGFTSCDTLREWSDQDYLERIYNEDYIRFDPDYERVRPLANAKLIQSIFRDAKPHIRHLDYGGGNGVLSDQLREQGWDSKSFDPFPSNNGGLERMGKQNLITAFEVFEHVPNPNVIMANMVKLIDDDGLILFSTLLSDTFIKPHSRIDWWYCAPRNGHVSLFSRKSLTLLAEKNSYRLASFNNGLHLMFKTLPAWASALNVR